MNISQPSGPSVASHCELRNEAGQGRAKLNEPSIRGQNDGRSSRQLYITIERTLQPHPVLLRVVECNTVILHGGFGRW